MTWTTQQLQQLKEQKKIRDFTDSKPTNTAAKKSKFKNIVCEYNGIRFDSIKERKRYIDLEFAQREGIIKDLKLQVPYVLVHTDDFKLTYVADFVYIDVLSGLTIVEDAKGFKTKEYKKKKQLMKKVYNIIIKET